MDRKSMMLYMSAIAVSQLINHRIGKSRELEARCKCRSQDDQQSRACTEKQSQIDRRKISQEKSTITITPLGERLIPKAATDERY